MGVQPISDRRTRRVADRTGLPIERLVRASNTEWLGRITQGDGHAHIRLDPRTLEWDADLGGCWSSCDTPRRLLRTIRAPGYSLEQRRADYRAVAGALIAVADAYVHGRVDHEIFAKADDAMAAINRLAPAALVPEETLREDRVAAVADDQRFGHALAADGAPL